MYNHNNTKQLQVNDKQLSRRSIVIQANREIRAELYDNGLYAIIHTPLDELSPKLFTEYLHMKALQVNRWKRVKRLKTKVAEILETGESLFLTLTFTDEYLASTTASTRRKYVARALGAYGVPYIANIDFGTDERYTKREHYHALIALKRIDNKDGKAWNYGSLNIKRTYNANSKRIARYITKLTYHAIKTPGRLLYARA